MGKRKYSKVQMSGDALREDSSSSSETTSKSSSCSPEIKFDSFLQSDLDSLSYSVSKLRKCFDTICSLCPEIADLDLDSPTLHNSSSRQAQSLQDPRMKLVQYIQRAFRTHQIKADSSPFIKDLFSATDVYSRMRRDQIESVGSGADIPSQKHYISDGAQKFDYDYSKYVGYSSTDETLGCNQTRKSWPPPLPSINDAKLLNQVFTHKSAANDQIHLSQSERLYIHNERLEFLGDSILNFTVSEIVYCHFPDASEGDLSVIRSSLICNDTLWEWATVYGLDKRLETSFNVTSEFKGKRSKIIADVLEAYIGGLYLDSPNGLSLAQNWIAAMVEPVIDSLKKEREEVEPLDLDAKNLLYVRIGSAMCTPEYVTIIEGTSVTPFTVECRVGEEVIGIGKGPNIKAAGTRAAMMALKNRKVIEKYSELRRNTPRHITRNSSELANVYPKDIGNSNSGILMSNKRTKSDKQEQGNPKNDLYSLIGSATQRPIYHTRENGVNSFISEVYIYDDILGNGNGRTKKEAEQNAAQMALENKELVSKWAKKRK